MFSKKRTHLVTPEIHSICTSRVDQPDRGVRRYWPLVIFIVLSALTQAVVGLFSD